MGGNVDHKVSLGEILWINLNFVCVFLQVHEGWEVMGSGGRVLSLLLGKSLPYPPTRLPFLCCNVFQSMGVFNSPGSIDYR